MIKESIGEIMDAIIKHIDESRDNFFDHIEELIEIRKLHDQNLSLEDIAKSLNKTKAHIYQKIRTFNKNENIVCGTNEKNYFFEHKNIMAAMHIKLIILMILETYEHPLYALLDDKGLNKVFGISYHIAKIYRYYILNGCGKNQYFHKLPESIKKEFV
ncbi:MAG: hypothetical protein E7490_02860 [Ruminococcaceae bacterium]|nr:hypothetical protein [Oscillospiraceae bacterium]